MAHWTAAIDGQQRNSSLHPRHCSDIFVPASCCRNWACLVVALRSALLFLYRASPVCSCIRTRHRVQFPTNAGIPLADVASDHFSRRCFCVLHVRSAVRSERPETNSALSVTVETVPRERRWTSVPPANWFAAPDGNRSRLFLSNEKHSLDFPSTNQAAPVRLRGFVAPQTTPAL
jgi:hypothetical protein